MEKSAVQRSRRASLVCACVVKAHGQISLALNFIKQNRSTPLSKEVVQIYLDYLAYGMCKYVLSATKSAILIELQTRAKSEEDLDARTVADSGLLHLVDELCGSRALKVRRSMCGVLGEIAWHDTTVGAVISSKPCHWLVSFLRDKDIGVVANAARALALISTSADGAKTAVAANVLDCITALLNSPNTTAREWTWQLLTRLIRHESTREVALRLNLCERLVPLLYDENLRVVENAARTLSWIAIPADGAKAVVQATVLDCVIKLLDSRAPGVRQWTCAILGEVASKKTMAPAVLKVKPCLRLVSLLRDENTQVVASAMDALSWIVKSHEGAHAAVGAKILDSVKQTLYSPKIQVRRQTCRILVDLGRHGNTVATILGVNPCAQLVVLSLHADRLLRTSALFALQAITESPAGVRAVAATDILSRLDDLMKAQDLEIRFRTCILLKNLAWQKMGVCQSPSAPGTNGTL
ncbi:armadillo-type protein [Mycena rosella]|uniref:Armadillo-type protein n=1 Tax=Mycena rosella TaxID=1033263 RepID=A0AAD7BSB5_MYCRO|nr:armadillo-type protein [Mycena rosella]